MSRDSLGQALGLNEIHFTEDGRVDWVEIYNAGEGAVSLEGLSLATRRDFSDRIELTGSVPAGGTAVVEVDIDSRGQMSFFLLNGGTVMQGISPGRPDDEGSAQAYPIGSDEWFIVGKSKGVRENNPQL